MNDLNRRQTSLNDSNGNPKSSRNCVSFRNSRPTRVFASTAKITRLFHFIVAEWLCGFWSIVSGLMFVGAYVEKTKQTSSKRSTTVYFRTNLQVSPLRAAVNGDSVKRCTLTSALARRTAAASASQ